MLFNIANNIVRVGTLLSAWGASLLVVLNKMAASRVVIFSTFASLLVAGYTLAVKIYNTISAKVIAIHSQIDSQIDTLTIDSLLIDAVAFLNSFAPVAEAFALALVTGISWGIILVIKYIWGIIPGT